MIDSIGLILQELAIDYLVEHLTLCIWEIAESEKRESLQETIVNF